jgi:hypothetical protein
MFGVTSHLEGGPCNNDAMLDVGTQDEILFAKIHMVDCFYEVKEQIKTIIDTKAYQRQLLHRGLPRQVEATSLA